MKSSTRPRFLKGEAPSFLLQLAAFVRRASINKGLCGVPTVRLTGEKKSAWNTNTGGVLGIVFVVLLAFASAFAQTGTIVGTVSDTTGAVVQGAQITVRNTATNESHADNQQHHRQLCRDQSPDWSLRDHGKKRGFQTLPTTQYSIDGGAGGHR